MTNAPTDPLIGRLIDGRYQVRSRIARGGMATVYLATDLRLERRVALKVMHNHLADDTAFKERFVQEARSAARLAHPNVVNVFDQGQDADSAYLVMEYLPGITLRDLLKDYSRLTPEQSLDILDAVLSGLAAAHKAGIVHRDLKPENVLLADDGRIKLGDFGLARASSANTATGQALLGTIAYLSPELVTRGMADARSDIYAVGIMLYEMLTGEQPFVGEGPMQIAYQHANDTVPTPSTRNPLVTPELDELVLWATSREPDDRPHDAREMLEHVRTIERGTPPAVNATATANPTMVIPPNGAGATADTHVFTGNVAAVSAEGATSPVSTALATKTKKRRKRGVWIFVAVLILALIAGGTGWYFGSGPGSLEKIPDVAGLAQAEAVQVLEQQGFSVKLGEQNDPEIEVGFVAATTPGEGERVKRGSEVTVLVSIGPQILPIPDVVNKAEEDARSALSDFSVTEAVDEEFSGSIAAGAVVRVELPDGQPAPAEYPERGELKLVISLGAVPNVVGMSAADAEAALTNVGLVLDRGEAEFSDDVPADHIISAEATADPVVKGTAISVVISKGQDLVEVPNVIGMTIKQARDTLEALDFEVTTDVDTPGFDLVLTTNYQSVPAGDKAKRFSTIEIRFLN